jgi:hypothetical protein
MALRIGSAKPPTEEMPEMMAEMPPTEPEVMPEALDEMADASTGGMVDPMAARYLGPESRCMGCIHFMEPNACEIVAGPIDPQGICMLFSADAPEQDLLDEPTQLPTDSEPVAEEDPEAAAN